MSQKKQNPVPTLKLSRLNSQIDFITAQDFGDETKRSVEVGDYQLIERQIQILQLQKQNILQSQDYQKIIQLSQTTLYFGQTEAAFEKLAFQIEMYQKFLFKEQTRNIQLAEETHALQQHLMENEFILNAEISITYLEQLTISLKNLIENKSLPSPSYEQSFPTAKKTHSYKQCIDKQLLKQAKSMLNEIKKSKYQLLKYFDSTESIK